MIASEFATNSAPSSADIQTMTERARALVPQLKQRAAETEELRNLPPQTAAQLHEAGLFRMWQPRRLGGGELDYVSFIDVIEEVAKGDVAVAWNLANLGSHHWMLGLFDCAAQNHVWDADVNALIASSFVFPAGRAQRVEGGYRLKGRWPFSSGVDLSSWNMLAGMVDPDDETQSAHHRIFLVPQDQYEVIDTWFTAGLKGTGSKDVVISELFVPEHMTLDVREVAGGKTPGSKSNPGPMFRLPVFALFPFVLSGCALGNAQACLDDFIETVRQRSSKYSQAKLANLQSMQIKIAEAGAKIDAARLIMRSICLEAMRDARSNQIPDLVRKTRYRRDGAYSVRLCTEAVDLLFSASGAQGLFLQGHMQRQFREAHAISAHIAFSFDVSGADNGRVELGHASENPVL